MDVLSVPFLHPLNDKPSFLSSITCLVVFMARPRAFQECTHILKFLGHPSLLEFCDCVIMFATRLPWQLKPSKVYPFCLDLFLFILVLGFHALVLGFPFSHSLYSLTINFYLLSKIGILNALSLFILEIKFWDRKIMA